MKPSNEISAETVHLAYQLMLWRNPESDQVISRHRQAADTIEDLRTRFLNSNEFYERNRAILARNIVLRGYQVQPGNIETEVTLEQQSALFDHVQKNWSEMGEVEPFYSVLSAAKYKPENFDKHKAEFESSGRSEVRYLKDRLRNLDIHFNRKWTCVELGCGVGRVTRFLAEEFKNVYGLDISKPHLDVAENCLALAGATNAQTVLIENLDDLEIPQHNLFYSKIVLQHNPPPVIAFLLNKVLSCLAPDGIAVFQLVTGIEGYSFNANEYLAHSHNIDGQELHAFPQKKVFEILYKHNCIAIEAMRDCSVSGFDRNSYMFIARRLN